MARGLPDNAAMGTLGVDARRSPRLMLEVPIEIAGAGAPVRAHTVVVSREGALVMSPRPFNEDELVRLQNLDSRDKVLCRFVWCAGEDLHGLFKLGLEIVSGTQHFWGDQYEDVDERPRDNAR
jgi:hypothetical protein